MKRTIISDNKALKDWLYQLADDELTLGHRDSEWLGLCPDIEGDVAFSSIAQDEVGHAAFYYQLLHELGEEHPDKLAFTREVDQRRNAILVERPNGDWVYSIIRHLFYDLYDQIRLNAMTSSSFLPLKHGVDKIKNEEHYHLLHMKSWFIRLGQAGNDSKNRLEHGIKMIWPELADLFHCGMYEEELVKKGIVAMGTEEMKEQWLSKMNVLLAEVELAMPSEMTISSYNGRIGRHSDDLKGLLLNMTEVYQLDPMASW